MTLQAAGKTDFASILSFYEDVIDRTPGIDIYAQWRKGIHPSGQGIMSAIEAGSMYLYRENGNIVGAMVLTMRQSEEYHAVAWSQQMADDEVAVIHMLGVSPDRQESGVGAEMVREAIRIARANGKKSVRLDATTSNTPVHGFYERLGFVNRGERRLYVDNAAWMDFCFFERSLL